MDELRSNFAALVQRRLLTLEPRAPSVAAPRLMELKARFGPTGVCEVMLGEKYALACTASSPFVNTKYPHSPSIMAVAICSALEIIT